VSDLLVLILSHEPFVTFSLPCPVEGLWWAHSVQPWSTHPSPPCCGSEVTDNYLINDFWGRILKRIKAFLLNTEAVALPLWCLKSEKLVLQLQYMKALFSCFSVSEVKINERNRSKVLQYL